MITPTYNDSVLIAEDFEAPHTIPIYQLFGRETYSRCSIYAQGPVGVMTLDKELFLQMIADNRLMLINVLNMLSSMAQKQHEVLDVSGIEKPYMRVAKWLLDFSSRPAKNIIIDADVEDWCSMLGLSEKQLDQAMQELIDVKCIEREDGKVKLIDRYGLQTFVSRNIARK